MTERIAYLGPAGSFCGAAAIELTAGRDSELIAAASVQAALDAARSGDVASALVPIENSVEGSVSVTLDELANGRRLVIVDEVVIPVRFALLVRSGTQLADITRIATHPHAQAQVRHWLAENLPDAQVIPAMSTASAAQALVDPDAPIDAAVSQAWPPTSTGSTSSSTTSTTTTTPRRASSSCAFPARSRSRQEPTRRPSACSCVRTSRVRSSTS